MLDSALRARLSPRLDATAARLGTAGVRAGTLTGLGLGVGVGACVAAGLGAWSSALGLWLLNRALDGLDGPLARQFGASPLGGMLDFTADFVVYGGFVVGVAVAEPPARVACTALLAAYLVNNVALLSFSSLVERYELPLGDERSLRLTSGLAEGTETILVYVAFCLLPGRATAIAWLFTALVAATAAQRVLGAVRALRSGALAPRGGG